jgi:hypothetical protein
MAYILVRKISLGWSVRAMINRRHPRMVTGKMISFINWAPWTCQRISGRYDAENCPCLWERTTSCSVWLAHGLVKRCWSRLAHKTLSLNLSYQDPSTKGKMCIA